MSLPRIFIPAKLGVSQIVPLDLAASRHILQVLRLQLNDSLIVFNDTNGDFLATITAIAPGKATITLAEFIHSSRESPLTIHLGQGISRGEKMDFTIQKAVELGVSTITPLFTEHCNVKLKAERLERRLQHWQKVAISASEQSGRCNLAQILPAQNLLSWWSLPKIGLCLLLDPNATIKISEIEERPDSITILVGPEGGWSDQELRLARQNSFLSIRLGPRILRTETTALAMISILQAKWGDF